MAKKQPPTFDEIKGHYTELLAKMVITPTQLGRFERRARDIIALKPKYQAVADEIGCPWECVAVIHYRESNLDFNTHLHNGDPLTARTRLVPRGRPKEGNPPFSWAFSAEDALRMKNWGSVTDWSPEHTCYLLEQYNGFGYRMYHPNVLSPYLWSGTNLTKVGKYASDGNFDPKLVDQQMGVMPLLAAIRKFDISKKEVLALSRKGRLVERSKKAIVGGGSAAAGLYMTAQSYWGMMTQFLGDHWAAVSIVSACSAWFLLNTVSTWIDQDYKQGNWTPSGMTDGETEDVLA